MTWKEFLISFLWLVSFDFIIGFILYIFWRYIDLRYFSTLEISTLKEENSYLKHENQKINGTSSQFWNEEDMK